MVDRASSSPSRIPVPHKSPSKSVNGKCSRGSPVRSEIPVPKHNDSALLTYSGSAVSKSTDGSVLKYSENPLSKNIESPVSKNCEGSVLKYSENQVSKSSGIPVSKYGDSPASKYSESPLLKHKDQYKNGMFDISTSSEENHSSGQPKKDTGFETFVMTGDMIIKTTTPQKPRKQEVMQKSQTEQPVENLIEMVSPSFGDLELETEENVSEFVTQLAQKDQTSAESGFEDQGQVSDSGTLERKQLKTQGDPSSVSDLSEAGSDDLIDMTQSGSSVLSNISTVSTPSDLKSDGSEPTMLKHSMDQYANGESSGAESGSRITSPDFSGFTSPDVSGAVAVDLSSPVEGDSGVPKELSSGSPSDSEMDFTSHSDGECMDGSKVSTSRSAEKISVSTAKSGLSVVRPSKSHENYLQSEAEFALVTIDIEDNMQAYSLDQIPQHPEHSSTSLENIGDGDNQKTSRSLHNSPERRFDKNDDRVFMPGFISLEEPRALKTKVKDRDDSQFKSDSSDSGSEGYENNSAETSVDLSSGGVETDMVQLELLSAREGGSASTGHARSLNSQQNGDSFSEHDSFDESYPGSSNVDSDDMDWDPDGLLAQRSKNVDRPSAQRLAKRLYHLDGFRKSDVSRHLSKKNDFSNLVAEEYLKFFDFTGDSLDQALRKFLRQFSLVGETQERERVLAHFSKSYIEANPGAFKSEDGCHTLVCAIMLLNTDLHGQNVGRKMSCAEFIENLAELNDGENFPKEILKALYHSIKTEQIEWDPVDEVQENDAHSEVPGTVAVMPQHFVGHNPFLDVPDPTKALEYKKGYVMRKCCMDADGRKTPFGKRGWKMFYAMLRDMVLYLHKDEHGMKKGSMVEGTNNAVRIHHALAAKAADYTKKQHVFRLQTSDWSEYLFQTSDSKELQDWIDTINLVASTFSAPPLPGACGSQNKFQRPLLPASCTTLNLRDQLTNHENRVAELEQEIHEHRILPPEKGSKSRVIQDYIEKEKYLEFELKRFKTYVYLLQAKLAAYPELEPSLVETTIGEEDASGTTETVHTNAHHKPVQRSLSDRGKSSPGLDNTASVSAGCINGEYINVESYTTYL